MPIFTRARFLPGSTIDGATMENVLMADGSVRFTSQNIDQEILERIISRAGEPTWQETLETDF